MVTGKRCTADFTGADAGRGLLQLAYRRIYAPMRSFLATVLQKAPAANVEYVVKLMSLGDLVHSPAFDLILTIWQPKFLSMFQEAIVRIPISRFCMRGMQLDVKLQLF